jgi:Uma2 family endonuclease
MSGSQPDPGAKSMSIQVQRRRFSVDDLTRMVHVGILAEHERVELIDGEVRQMSPIGPLHAGIVNRLIAILTNQLGDRAIVSVQNPVVLNDFTEPQPDVLVLRPREDFYTGGHPRPKDVLVLIEVADTTMDYDCGEKIPRYAQMQIPEVWLVDVHGQEVVQYTHPVKDEYHSIQAFVRGMELTSASAESLHLPIEDLFPARR